MSIKSTVTLSSNGKYWQALYYDNTGQRRAKGLGPKKELSRRKAKVMCDRLAAELQLNPVCGLPGRAFRLGDYLERYIASRTDLRPKTLELHKLTKKYLLAYFGADVRIDKINRAMASDWRVALAKGELTKTPRPAEATICQYIRNAKVMFNHAVRDDLVLYNPFDRLKGNTSEPDKKWKYVTREELHQLLEACPSISWRLLLALCRIGGLRQGEALSLLWSDIDWEARRLDVMAEKTGRRRVVPIEPGLYSLLLEAFSAASEREKLVIPRNSIRRSNLWRDFGVICKRAKLERWAKWCHVLRKNCETDWAQRFPQYVVSAWSGHSIEVSARYYLQVPEELYEKVAATNMPQTATKCHVPG
jgi:integrase